MIKQSDIMAAINQLIVTAFPDHTVYIQKCPEDFDRPSFLLEYIKISQRDVSMASVEKTVHFTITCFVESGNHDEPEMDRLANLQDNVLCLFQGYLEVKDRALNVKSIGGGIDANRAYIEIQFGFFDDRTDTKEQIPLVTSVHTNIKEE